MTSAYCFYMQCLHNHLQEASLAPAVLLLLTHEHPDTRIATAAALCATCPGTPHALLRRLCEDVLARNLTLERLLPAYCVLWAACQVHTCVCDIGSLTSLP